MVTHEAVGIDFTGTFSTVSYEGMEESFVINIQGEDVLLVDTSFHDVVDSGTAFDAGSSGNEGFLLK